MELATIFPSKYIKAADLKGREATVVIARAEMEKLGDDTKLVLYFQGKEKGLVTNRTNADRIAYLYGSNTDSWIGCEIILYTDMVNFQGKVTEAIRVKPPAKRQPAQQNGGKPALEHVVEPRSGYQLSSTRRPDPIEEVTGAPTRGVADEEIPF